MQKMTVERRMNLTIKFDDDLPLESVNDISPIEYNRHCNSPSDLAYIEIFNEALKNLQNKKYSLTELFRYCLDICHKIFSLSEFKYGKPAKDIPNYIWEATGEIFDLKSNECTDEDLPNKKYDYRTSYSDFPTFETSLSDMAKVILKAEFTTIDTISKKAKYDSLFKLRKNYFDKFFGLKFEESSDNHTHYENLRLLKIFYDCVSSVDLAYLLRMSLLKQNYEIPSAYTKATSFIKERILLRNANSEYFIGFSQIMALEKYSNVIRSFINSFSERVVSEPLETVKNLSVGAIRKFCVELYQSVIDNINNLESAAPDKIHDPKCVQIYAYEHFLLTDIDQPNYEEFFSDIFLVEADESFYNRLAIFLKSIKFETVALAEIPEFVEKYKKDLVEILYPKTIDEVQTEILFLDDSDGKCRARKQKLKRHREDYEIIGRIYNWGIHQPEGRKLSVFELILIVYLYETSSDNRINIPLYSGYEPKKEHHDLKIKALVKNIRSRNNGQDSNLPEEQYFLACYWITEQMNTLINYRTVEIQKLREQMKIKILNYWLNRYPLLTEGGLKINYDELIETILPHKTYETIFKKYFD